MYKISSVFRTRITQFRKGLGILLLFAAASGPQAQAQQPAAGPYPFQNENLSVTQRVADLVGRLTLPEKIALMQNDSKAVPRLHIPAYNWWNECLHGVARDGIATVFPQAIGLAATWDTALMHHIATTISTEARAKHEEHIRHGERGIYQGLTFWTPNINIFRDPRWGRGQETYGEDPFLTASMGVAFVTGLQGNNDKYFKVIATAKHFAVHSGSEYNRHTFDAVVAQKDLFDTYLPAFEALVKQGHVYSLMGAYNSVDGVPACANTYLLDTILRKKWGFKGYVVSDCGAITDIYRGHKYAQSMEQAAAFAVNAGCDLTCGTEYQALGKAVKDGLITTAQIDISVSRLLTALFRLGMFDDSAKVAYRHIPYSQNNDPEHDALSKKAAEESIVLLKNKNGILPLSKTIKTIAVVGPFAQDDKVLLGNYNGEPAAPVNYLKGIRGKIGPGTQIITSSFIKKPNENYTSTQRMNDSVRSAVDACKAADLVIFCGGISAEVEGEESGIDKPGFFHGDRTSMDLPADQQLALKALKKEGKKVILVLSAGSAMALNWAKDNLDGILTVWYPGQQGGNALADVLFGDCNPAGRLPITYYHSLKDLPAFEDYSMKGRTYRYFEGKVLYPFGYGLSYTTFGYRDLQLSAADMKATAGAQDSLTVTLQLSNKTGKAGAEVVQLYGAAENIPGFRPVKTLLGFERVLLDGHATQQVRLRISLDRLRQYDPERKDYYIYPGKYRITAGGSSADSRLSQVLTLRD